MKRIQSWAVIGLTACTLALAGCPGETPEDGGPSEPDVSEPEDAGTEPEPSPGQPEEDAGTEPEPSPGQPEEDAGPGEPEEDAGPGEPEEDAGPGEPEGDAGQPVDGGEPEGDAGQPVDGGEPEGDAGQPVDGGPGEPEGDAGPPVDGGVITPNPNASAAIAAVRAETLPTTIDGAFVTAVKAEIGSDAAGFFVQAEQTGPALFVEVDASTAGVSVGDEVAFEVTEVNNDSQGRLHATTIGAVSVASSGNNVQSLVQDLTDATDVVSNLDDYEAELVTATVTATSAPSFAGGGFLAFEAVTEGMPGATDLRVRFPDSIDLPAAGIVPSCTMTVAAHGMWRFDNTAQFAFFDLADLSNVTGCDALVEEAVATSPATVVITANRLLDPSTVEGDGSDFTFDNGLTATAAVVDGATITVTTSAQVGGTDYTVTVANTVTDVDGTPLSPNTATFSGFVASANLLINEVNANIPDGCDLVEFYVTEGGSLNGLEFTERTSTVFTFPELTVAAGDVIVLHFDGNDADCNPGAATDEVAIDGNANAVFPQNYDTAFDFYSTDSGLTATDNTFTVIGPTGYIDAVLLSDDPAGTAAAASETAAAAVADAGEWTTTAGGVPAGGFVDDDFSANAVLDLNDTSPDAFGNTIQRSSLVDNNNKDDWTVAPFTWGVANAGQ